MDKKKTSMVMGGSRSSYLYDFSTFSDGSLPSPFVGSTWTIATGAALNTPTEGSNIAIYGDGETEVGWATYGGAPSTSERSTEQVHGGTYSRKIITDAAGKGLYSGVSEAITAGRFYKESGYLYVSSGAATLNAPFYGTFLSIGSHNAASWKQITATGRASGTPNNYFATASTGGGAAWYIDDVTIKQLTNLMALIRSSFSLAKAKATFTIAIGENGGVVLCADTNLNPTSYVVGYVQRLVSGTNFITEKFVAGTFTVVASTAITYSAGAPVELRHISANTFQTWYNNVQVGTDITISDAQIISNKCHGLFSGGGATTNSFFLERP